MAQRRRLDAFLVEQAVAAGAEFRDGVRVSVDSDTELHVDREQVEVGAVIGADGANGITARSLGLGGAVANRVALEGNLPTNSFRWGRGTGDSFSSSPSCRAATAGSSRRATTSTWASAAGATRARIFGATFVSSVSTTASSYASFPIYEATVCRCGRRRRYSPADERC